MLSGHLCNDKTSPGFKPHVDNYACLGDAAQEGLESQFASFACRNLLAPSPEGDLKYNILYVVWIGINDCSQTSLDDMEKTIEHIFECLDSLYPTPSTHGASYLSMCRQSTALQEVRFEASQLFFPLKPYCHAAIGSNSTEDLAEACQMWNDTFARQCKEWAAGILGANVLLWSSHNALTDILDDPEEYDFQEYDVEEAGGAIWQDELHLTSEVHEVLAEKLRDSFKSLPSVSRAAESAVDGGAKLKRSPSACDAGSKSHLGQK